jgi:hypothetical protein|tara:strand:- start:3134 stop:3715 length:582 start_codon:yes stop_codon:yes gene_type:complete
MTFKILENFPDKLLKDIQKQWYGFPQHPLGDAYHKRYAADEYQDYIFINKPHPLYDILFEYFNCDMYLTYLRNKPRSGNGPVHTDSKREACINIPIEVDLLNSSFYMARMHYKEPTVRKPNEDEPVNEGALRFEWEPEKYLFYNLKKPILFSTKQAHGAYNYSDNERVLLSVTFKNEVRDFQSVMNIIPKDWF